MINKNVLPGSLPKIHTKVSPLNNLYYICPNLVHTKKNKKKQAKKKKTNKQTKKQKKTPKTTKLPQKTETKQTNKQK